MALTILITSVGSLVGQNLLDALDGRRDGVRVVGLNSLADAANNFRCDRVHLSPNTAERERYRRRLLEVIERERPDLLLSGRDEELELLARLRGEGALGDTRFIGGSPESARMMGDKRLTHQFARERGLPFADTADGSDPAGLRALVARHGLPLIAKPHHGNGSRGVMIVLRETQLERLAAHGGYLLQQLLDPPEELAELEASLELGLPLFYSLPERRHYAAMMIIAPDGELAGLCTTRNEMVMGRCERSTPSSEPAFERLVRDYAAALAEAGWAGPVNLQCKRDAEGRFIPFELNARFSGATSARQRLGFDELGLAVERFLGPGRLAPPPPPAGTPLRVDKQLTDFTLLDEQVAELRENGSWRPRH